MSENTNFPFHRGIGKAVADAIGMILVIIRMKVIPDKHSELCQAIVSLIGSLRNEQGCRRSDFCQSIEDENELQLLEEWDTRGNFNQHLKSDLFRVLRGAMTLLQQPCEMRVYGVPAPKKENITARPEAGRVERPTGIDPAWD